MIWCFIGSANLHCSSRPEFMSGTEKKRKRVTVTYSKIFRKKPIVYALYSTRILHEKIKSNQYKPKKRLTLASIHDEFLKDFLSLFEQFIFLLYHRYNLCFNNVVHKIYIRHVVHKIYIRHKFILLPA